MTYTLPTHIVELDLVCELRKVLNDPKYNCLCNETKSEVLLEELKGLGKKIRRLRL